MLDVVKQLLILQERDRTILQICAELDGFEIQRKVLQAKATSSQANWEALRQKLMQIETERKKLELEVEDKTQLIQKYALQQFQTKKNEEYRALAHEIELCKAAIVKLEDQQLELMEQAETIQKEGSQASRLAKEIQSVVEAQMNQLATRETQLTQELANLQSDRSQLAATVAEPYRNRYERLLKQRGEKVMVGIDRGVCGGCHMKLPPQNLISCQSDEEIVSCPNCGRLLYYTPEMESAHPEN
jgi:predicted  nucleic acid-binding Zn-ribbon protein